MATFKSKDFESNYRKLCDALEVPELVGTGTYRISHPACGDGRRRMYFTSTYEDGAHVVKAYCHNCQRGAVGRIGSTLLGMVADTALRTEESSGLKLPPELPHDIESVMGAPDIARDWFRYYKLDHMTDIEAYWSASLGRLVFPVRDRNIEDVRMTQGEYLGYIARALPGAMKGTAKYITACGSKPLRTWFGGLYLYDDRVRGQKVVFVEDMISAAVVGKNGHVGVPLFGLNIQPENILTYMRMFSPPVFKPVVWLDNDDASVRARERLEAVLRAFGYNPKVISGYPEPKKCSDVVLNTVLGVMVNAETGVASGS